MNISDLNVFDRVKNYHQITGGNENSSTGFSIALATGDLRAGAYSFIFVNANQNSVTSQVAAQAFIGDFSL